MNTKEIINKAAISTANLTAGLLNPEQSKQFIKQTFEATVLGGKIRREMRRAKTGEIDKIGIAARILRKKVENIDANSDGSAPALDPITGQTNGYRATVNTSSVEYATTAVRLPWDITEETLRENIEGHGFEQTVTNLMTSQLGVDLEDLYLNGDTAAAAGGDHDFLYINDGWIKQIQAGGHVIDAASKPFDLNLFYNGVAAIPNKYNNGKLAWIASPFRVQQWEQYLLNAALDNGASVPDGLYKSPAGIPFLPTPSMPNDKIMLVDPKNLIVINTYDIKIRKTAEGKSAIMQDKRFYVIHLDFDAIIEELDATAIITNVGV